MKKYTTNQRLYILEKYNGADYTKIGYSTSRIPLTGMAPKNTGAGGAYASPAWLPEEPASFGACF